MAKSYNQMHEKLVKNKNDFAGMIAYSIYKTEKRDAIRKDLDVNEFTRLKLQPNEIKKYQREADELVNLFLQAAADDEIDRIKEQLSKEIIKITIKELPIDPLYKKIFRWHNTGASGVVGNFWTGVIIAVFVWIMAEQGATIGLLGASKLASATDGTNTASGTCTIAPATGWAYTTLAGTLNTSNTSLLFNGVPAAVVGDQIVGETAKITLYSTLDAETSYVGTQTLYHIAASDGIWRSFTLTTGNAGGSNVTYTLTGLSTTSSNGLVVGLSSGIIKTITPLFSGLSAITPCYILIDKEG